MGAASLIAAKDLKLRIRDRSAFIIGVIAPLGLAIIFNLVLGNVAEGDFVPVYAVTDLDRGTVSEGLVSVLEQIDSDGVIELAERPDTEEEARQLAEGGTVSAAIVIPEGFSSAVATQSPTTVTVIANPDSPTSAEIARSIAEGFASEVRTSQLAIVTAVGSTDEPLPPDEIARLAQEASAGLPEAVTIGRVEAATR